MRDFEPILATIRRRGEAKKKAHKKAVVSTCTMCVLLLLGAGMLFLPGEAVQLGAPVSMEFYTESYSSTSTPAYILISDAAGEEFRVIAPEQVLAAITLLEAEYPSYTDREYLYSETLGDESEAEEIAGDLSSSLLGTEQEYRICYTDADGGQTGYVLKGNCLQRGKETVYLDEITLEKIHAILGIGKGDEMP